MLPESPTLLKRRANGSLHRLDPDCPRTRYRNRTSQLQTSCCTCTKRQSESRRRYDYAARRSRRTAKAVPAFAAKAQENGAVILQNCAVRGIETTNGRVTAVLTEKGRLRCEAVVVAGGAWSRLIVSEFNAHLPQLKVRSSVFRTAALDAGVEPAIAFSDFALRKRLDGGYTVASLGGSIADIVPDSFRFFAISYRRFRANGARCGSDLASAFRRSIPVEASTCRSGLYLRENPYTRPCSTQGSQCSGACETEAGNPFFRISHNSAGVGRSHRYDAGCHSGYFTPSGR